MLGDVRPMPLLAPVTKATFPSSCRSTADPFRRAPAPGGPAGAGKI